MKRKSIGNKIMGLHVDLRRFNTDLKPWGLEHNQMRSTTIYTADAISRVEKIVSICAPL